MMIPSFVCSSPPDIRSFRSRGPARAPQRRAWLRALLAVPGLALFAGLVTEARAQTVVGTVPNNWALKPSGLGPGDRFRLLFVTSTTRDATSEKIADYDAFVQGRAAAGHTAIRAHSSHFRVLGSTATTNAREHTHTTGTGSEATYWLNGAKVADNYSDLYDDTWDSGEARTESGTTITLGPNAVFTGTSSNGLKNPFELGGPSLGDKVKTSSPSTTNPLDGGINKDMNLTGHFYALSRTFQVEPTITIAQKGQTATRDAQGRRRVAEGTTLTYTVSANKAPASALDITLNVSETGAFVISSAKGAVTVTIPANAKSVDHAIASSNDTTDEVNGTLTVALRDDPGYALGTDTSVVDIIRDNDVTTVTLSAPSGDIYESDTKTITVTLGRALASGEALPVPLTFAGGATRNTDYTLAGTAATGVAYANLNSGNATVTFTGRASASATATLTLTATRDTTAESSGETVSVGLGTLTSASGTGLGGTLGGGAQGSGSASFKINDSPLPVVSITAGTSPVTEGTAAAFTIKATPAPLEALSVSLTVSEETSDGRDFVATMHESSQTVNVPTSGSATYSVPTVADTIDEPDGAVTVAITASPTTYTVGSMGTATVTVQDTPHTVSVSIAADAAEGDSGHTDRAVTFTVAPARSTLNDVYFDICLTGLATHGGDYTLVDEYGSPWAVNSGCMFISTFESLGRFIDTEVNIRVKGDTAIEPDETVVLTLSRRTGSSAPTPADVVLHTTAYTATHTIENDDDPPINLSVNNNGAVTEGGTLTVTATAGQAPSGRSLGIPLQRVAAHSTAAAADYSGAGSITIADGQTSGTATLTAVNDTADEPTETLRLALGTLPSGYDPGPNSHVDLTLADNDATTVTLAGTAGNVTEGGTKTITLALGRGLTSGETLTAPLTFAGTATRNTDYTMAGTAATGVTYKNLNSGSASVVFTGPATEATATVATITLTATADTDAESGGETVDIGLGTVTQTGLGGGTSKTVTLATFRINDVTLPVVTIAGGSAVTEGTEASFTVTASPVPTSNLTVNLRVADAPHSDFVSATNQGGGKTVAVPTTGTTTYTVATVGGSSETTDEPNGAVTTTLLSGDGYTLGSTFSASTTVNDNDATTLTLTTPDTTATEGDASETARLVLTLGRALRAGESLGVPLAFSGGTAGTDFTLSLSGSPTGVALAGTTVTFTGSDSGSAETAAVPLVAESDSDTVDETVTVSLGTLVPNGLGGGATGSRTGNGQIVLTDADAAVPTLTITGGPAVTEGTEASFTVTADPAPPQDVEGMIVNIGVQDAPGADFLAADIEGNNGFWLFDGGVASRDFSIPTQADRTPEPDGPVTVTIRPRSGNTYTVGTPSSAQVMVNDGDDTGPPPPLPPPPPLVSLTIAGGGPVTGGTAVLFTVSASAAPADALAVGVSVAEGPGNDSVAPEEEGLKTVTIAAGDTSAVLRVPTVADQVGEIPHGAVTATLQGGAGYVLGATTSATVTVRGDDGSARVHRVPYLPSASHPHHDGVVRVINRSAQEGEVSIAAFDDAGAEYGPLTLRIGANKAVHFDSARLEEGDAQRGLSGGVGEGEGDWRLAFASALDVEVLSYVRARDGGALASTHDVAPTDEAGAHRVVFFNPASNLGRVSRLRLVNPGEEAAAVRITGVDDAGEAGESAVELILAGGVSRSLGAQALESGEGEGLAGALGDGAGKWRLRVTADRSIRVMSLLAAGPHLTNVSTASAPDMQVHRVPPGGSGGGG